MFKQRDLIGHDQLVTIQNDILLRFGFDFNIPSLFPFVESYLSVIYNNTEQQAHHQSVKLLCSFFAVQVQLSSRYLGKKPSIMAACIVTLAVDLFNANEKCFKSLTSDELSRTLNDDLMETLKHQPESVRPVDGGILSS